MDIDTPLRKLGPIGRIGYSPYRMSGITYYIDTLMFKEDEAVCHPGLILRTDTQP